MEMNLGERELDVMGVLWREGQLSVAEVRERLPAELAYNTVLTILRNLEAKGFVGHTAVGRLFHYFPEVTEHAVRGSALSRVVDKLFRGSRIGMVTHLLENDALSTDELRSLYELVDRHATLDRAANDPGTRSPGGGPPPRDGQ